MAKAKTNPEKKISKPDSAAKAAYRALIETYAKQNPAKFAEKKAALFAKLETL